MAGAYFIMNNEEYKKFYIEATKVLDVIEDSVAHICDEHKLSVLTKKVIHDDRCHVNSQV